MDYFTDIELDTFAVKNGRAIYTYKETAIPKECTEATSDDVLIYLEEQQLIWDTVLKYINMARLLAYRYNVAEVDDAVHEVLPRMMNAVHQFDPARKLHLSTYMYKAIRWGILNYVKESNPIRTNHPLPERIGICNDLIELENNETVEYIRKRLNEYQRWIIDSRRDGLTFREMADISDKSFALMHYDYRKTQCLVVRLMNTLEGVKHNQDDQGCSVISGH